MQRLRLKAPTDLVEDYLRLFVNRRAYTLQSDRPHPESGRHYYYRPTDKTTGQGLSLTSETVRRHIEGVITIGLYAINPATQRCKWVAIDADYKGAMEDLVKLQYYLSEDQVQAALEMSQRGGHLWIFLETPLLARDCRTYIHNLASRLGVPVKGNGLAEGIEIFPKHDELGPGEFGNTIRGPLGIHWGASRRFWFYWAEYDPEKQMAYLKQLRKVSEEEEMRRFIAGKTLPAQAVRRPRCPEPAAPRANSGGARIPHSRARRQGSQGRPELRHSPPLLRAGRT